MASRRISRAPPAHLFLPFDTLATPRKTALDPRRAILNHMSRWKFALLAAPILTLFSALLMGDLSVSNAQSGCGYRTINGTQVEVCVDLGRGIATFNNNCGSQTLTQGQLAAGAIPNQIIPCPRGGGGGDDFARRDAERRAFCEGQKQRGIDAANRGDNAWDGRTKVIEYETAIAAWKSCGFSRSDMPQLLRAARQQAAAEADDNRVEEARRSFGGNDPYRNSGRAFGNAPAQASSPSPQAAKPPIAIRPEAVYERAQQRCAYANSGSALWKKCMITQEARLITEADPEIAAACATQPDTSLRSRCAIDAFVAAVKKAAVNPSGEEFCYYDERGAPCHAGGAGRRGAAATRSLRDEIRDKLRRLQTGDEGVGPGESVPDTPTAAARPAEEGARPSTANADWNRDDPLQHFLHGSGSSGNRNDGQLSLDEQGKPRFHAEGLETPPDARRFIDETLQHGGPLYGPPNPTK